MKLIIGLGNPGNSYLFTRHNIGFMLVDALSLDSHFQKKHKSLIHKTQISNTPVLLVKPQTYMNLSGEAVSEITNFYKISIENILVIQDDKDQNFLSIKFQKSRGHGGHNGIRSIHKMIATKDYARLKLGIANKTIRSGLESESQSDNTDFEKSSSESQSDKADLLKSSSKNQSDNTDFEKSSSKNQSDNTDFEKSSSKNQSDNADFAKLSDIQTPTHQYSSINNYQNDYKIPTSDFVLSNFNKKEQEQLPDFLKEASEAVICFIEKGFETASNQYNKRV